jgi:hypothetical protein
MNLIITQAKAPLVIEDALTLWISLFLPYERNTEQVRMPAPVGSGGLG